MKAGENGKKRRGRILAGLLLCLAVLTAGGVCAVKQIKRHNEFARGRAARYELVEKREKAWIMGNQTPSGVFVTYQKKEGGANGPEANSVNPYFSNIAAQSLLEGKPDRQETEAVKRYLNWYLTHLNPTSEDRTNGAGTIFDYTVYLTAEGQERTVSREEYDSVDSYAGTFLWLAAEYVRKTGDREWVKEKEEQLWLVTAALLHCMDGQGRSFGKREYPVRYLMDNCEVNAGLKGAKELFSGIPGNESRCGRVDRALEENTKQLQSDFWNEREKRYEIGFDSQGEPLAFRGWDCLYAEASAQVFPLVWEAAEAGEKKTQTVYAAFCEHWEWERMDYVQQGESRFYWTAFCYAGALMGDEERTERFLATYEEKTAESREYPLHIDDAGWIVKAAGTWRTRYEEQVIWREIGL